MPIAVLLYAEILLFCIAILAFIWWRAHSVLDIRNRQHLFDKVLAGQMIFFLSDLLWVLVEQGGLPAPSMTNWLLNAVYYVQAVINGYLWFCYAQTVQGSSWVKTRKHAWLWGTPILVLIVLTLASLKTGWMFYITEDGAYQRGPLYFFLYLFSYGYVILAAVSALFQALRTQDLRRRAECLSLILFVVPVLVAAMIQVFVPQLPLLCVGITLGLLIVFVNFQEQMVSVDALTHLNNRRQLNRHLSAKLQHPEQRERLHLLILDVDRFKTINDQFGHIEGDRALQITADALRTVCQGRKSYFICRYAGDEFVILCDAEDEEIPPLCQELQETLSRMAAGLPYSLTFSIGHARCSEGVHAISDLVDLADAHLYQAKNRDQRSRD